MDNEISTIDNLIKDYRLKLGDKIKLVREERGYSQEQLAVLWI
jgi:DNA-binding XRE family transcriptional regulator